MAKIPPIISILIVLTFSCNSSVNNKNQIQELKLNQIRYIISKTGFMDLPLTIEAWNSKNLVSKYDVDVSGIDSSIFERQNTGVIGFLPDTSNYFAVLFYTIGDMAYPTIMTINKLGEKIDRQIICTGGCASHATVDVSSCYDSVWIDLDLKIESISKVIGIVETDDSIPKILKICNKRLMTGHIDKKGNINIKESDIIDCNELSRK